MSLPVLQVERSLVWTTCIVFIWTVALCCVVHCTFETAQNKKKKRITMVRGEEASIDASSQSVLEDDLASKLAAETATRVAIQTELEKLKALLKSGSDGLPLCMHLLAVCLVFELCSFALL
jgi:hypothetical protein